MSLSFFASLCLCLSQTYPPLYIYIYIYIYGCVCGGLWVCIIMIKMCR